MEYLTKTWYTFQSSALANDTFGVLSFKGREALSESYEFRIQLITSHSDILLDEVIQRPAVFKIHHADGQEMVFHGILMEMDEFQTTRDFILYEAVLVPRFRWLRLTRHNQIFLQRTLPEMIEEVLKDGELSPLDYDLRVEQSYPVKEFVCQYGESHEQFVCRWMERDGLYYFFEQVDDRERLVITDTRLAHRALDPERRFVFSPDSGLDASVRGEAIQSLVLRQKMVPGSLRLKDYNYRRPSLNLECQADVADHGHGEIYEYGDHYQTPEEGTRLARARAQEYQCQERIYHGRSLSPWFRPGFTFHLHGHFRESFNRPFLVTSVNHEGAQTAFLVDGLKQVLSEREHNLFYSNTFTAIPAEVQFRPQRMTPKPKFNGTLNAHIDAAGGGQYAELDDQGRYKVVLPFDLAGRQGGKASAWLRMAQPYAGSGHGMHFPLHKGTEVLLTFIEGDPDRPIIAAAVPNPENPSVVSNKNPTRAGFTTAGGGHFYAEDSKGHERFVLKSGDDTSMLTLGSGSGSRFDLKSDGALLLGTGVQSVLAGLGKHSVVALADTSLTGLWWLAIVEMVAEIIAKRGPSLMAKLAVKDQKEPENAQDEEKAEQAFEKIEQELEFIVEAVATLVVGITTRLTLEHKLKNAYDQVKANLLKPAFTAVSYGKNTIVQNKGSGQDIVLGTDGGVIHFAAQKDIGISAGENVDLNGKNTYLRSMNGLISLRGNELSLEKNVLLGAEASITMSKKGDLKIEKNPSAYGFSNSFISISGENADIEIMQGPHFLHKGTIKVESHKSVANRVSVNAGKQVHQVTVNVKGVSIAASNFAGKKENVIDVSDRKGVEVLAKQTKLTDVTKASQFILDKNGISKKAKSITLKAIQKTTLTATRINIG